jgi:hypothetical protein
MTEDFEAAAATTLAAMLKTSIRRVFPSLSRCDRDAVFISVLDRMARTYGFAVKPDGRPDGDDTEI